MCVCVCVLCVDPTYGPHMFPEILADMCWRHMEKEKGKTSESGEDTPILSICLFDYGQARSAFVIKYICVKRLHRLVLSSLL